MLSDTEASCLGTALAVCLKKKEKKKRRWMKEWLKPLFSESFIRFNSLLKLVGKELNFLIK